jgi:hypothetical protein
MVQRFIVKTAVHCQNRTESSRVAVAMRLRGGRAGAMQSALARTLLVLGMNAAVGALQQVK